MCVCVCDKNFSFKKTSKSRITLIQEIWLPNQLEL